MRTVVFDGLFRGLVLGGLVGSCLILSGCAPATETTPKEKAKEAVQVEEEPLEVRDSMEGRWIFRMVQQTVAIPFSLIDVETDGETWTVKAPDIPSPPDAPVFKSGTATSDTIEIAYTLTGALGEIVYHGRLIDGTVRGTIEFTGGTIALGYLQATRLEVLPQKPQMLPFNREYEKVLRDENPSEGLREFTANHPESALAIIAYQRYLAFSRSAKTSSEDIRSVIADFEKSAAIWGPKRQSQVAVNVAAMLGGLEYQPEIAREYATKYRESLTAEQLANEKITTPLGVLDSRIEFAQNLTDLKSDDAAKEALAVGNLEKILAENPLNARAVLALGEYFREKPDLDNAIKYYARLIAVPTLEKTIVDEIMASDPSASLPNQQLTELWKKKHGKLSGLDDYLNESYRETFATFANGKDVPARGEGEDNKVALMELFTSGSSAECLAADAAIDVLGSIYEPTELIVVRYHQHIPTPDPLATQAMKERFRYYNARSMPALFINGRPSVNVSGSIDGVGNLVTGFKMMVDESIKEKVEIAFDVKAVLDGNEINISATIDNLDDSDGGEYYLRLVLAESEILHRSGNGIRIHKMVVRTMPGGSRGLIVKDGKVSYEGKVVLSELKKQINNELAMIEQMAGTPMPNRPLDFENLKLVAVIQDDVDRRVVQSQVVNVTAPGAEPAAPVEPESPKAEEKKDTADKPQDDAKVDTPDEPVVKPDDPPASETEKKKAMEEPKAKDASKTEPKVKVDSKPDDEPKK